MRDEEVASESQVSHLIKARVMMKYIIENFESLYLWKEQRKRKARDADRVSAFFRLGKGQQIESTWTDHLQFPLSSDLNNCNPICMVTASLLALHSTVGLLSGTHVIL